MKILFAKLRVAILEYRFHIVILLLAINSAVTWYNYDRSASIDDDTNLWFSSKFGETKKNRELIKGQFSENLFYSVKKIKTEITTPMNQVSGLLKDYRSAQVLNPSRDENSKFKTGLFYLNEKKVLSRKDNYLEMDNIISEQQYRGRIYGDTVITMYNMFINNLKNNVLMNDTQVVDMSSKLIKCLDVSELKNRIPGIEISRAYIAGDDGSLVIYPYTSASFKRGFVPSGRFWWNAAFSNETKSEFIKNEAGDVAGLTSVYTDIESHDDIKLVRTYWYKFSYSRRGYIICFDFFVNSNSNVNIINFFGSSIPLAYILIVFEVLLLLFLFLIYRNYKSKMKKYFDVSNAYRVQRQDIMYLSNASQKVLEISIRTSDQSSNWSRYGFGSSWIFAGSKAEYFIGHESQRIHGTEIKLSKKFDLSLTNSFSTKAIELWYVERTNVPEIVGYFEVIWYQHNHEDVKINDIYWNSNMEKEVVKNVLKSKILRTEIDSFVFSPQETSDPVDLALETLKMVPQIATFSHRYESFSKRKLDFDFEMENIYDFITQIYQLGDVSAVCSVEFMRKLKEIDKLKQILNIPVSRRIVIENPERDLKSFVERELTEDEKSYLMAKDFDYKLVTSNSHIAYRNKDFSVIETRNKIKFVLVTNISDGEVNSGWISWREVDIIYYTEILNSLNGFTGSKFRDFIRLTRTSLN